MIQQDIGALELGAAAPFNDTALEVLATGPSTTPYRKICPAGIEDGMLESVATLSPNYSGVPHHPQCPRGIDDGALETEAPRSAGPGPRTLVRTGCAQIEDGALEQAAGPTRPTGIAHHPMCRGHIDDAALERSIAAGPQSTGIAHHPLCRHIDDAALERFAGPITPTNPVLPGCHHIDDMSLETAAQMNPSPSGLPSHPMCRHIDDADLEQAAGLTAGPGHTLVVYQTKCLN